MKTARKMYLFAAAVFVFLLVGVPTEMEAQDGGGVTCGWCVMKGDLVGQVGNWEVYENLEHAFVDGGEECGWEGRDAESIGGGPYCSRCGNTSVCHTDFRDGPCHRACGPLGDLFAALEEVESALEGGDVTAVAAALLEPTTGGSLEFIPDAGRIDIMLACAPGRVFGAIPVLPDVRDRLRRAIALPAVPSTR